MRITSILLVLSVLLMMSPAGFRIVTEVAILILGSSLPIQAAIYSIRDLRRLRPLRGALIAAFERLPVALGFGVLVLFGVSIIGFLVFLTRDHISPSDSWVPFTLGVLWGIMSPILRIRKSSKINREQAEDGNTSQHPC